MKLLGSDGAAFCRAPDPTKIGALLHGPDRALIAENRRVLVSALSEDDDLRVTRLDPADLRRDATELGDALRARGFFPGRRVVLVEGARDSLTAAATSALEGLTDEDAFLVLEADALAGRSSLRKLFESGAGLVSAAFYPGPPDIAEIEATLAREGLACGLSQEARSALLAVASEVDRGTLRPFLTTLATYAAGRDAPLGPQDVLALSPQPDEADADRLIAAVAGGEVAAVSELMRRYGSGPGNAVQAMIPTGRHFRQLFSLAAAPDGIDPALGRLRPPAFGPRRRMLASQARNWGPARLEAALRLIHETEKTLRTPGDRPAAALAERCLMRLAMMGSRARR